MSQDFKLKFESFKDNDPTEGETSKPGSYPTSSNTRNLGFTWPDGKMKFLNYAYLVSGEYFPDDNQIVLKFTTHTVTLKGAALQSLYCDLMQHLPANLKVMNDRYNATKSDNEPVINEIVFEEISK